MLYGALGGAMLYGAASRTAVWRGAQAWRLGLNCEAAAAAQPHGRCGAEGQRRRAAVSVPYFIGETLLAEMDKIYVDSNMENDNTEHIRGKRLSSILKAPRNPLDDLGNGNELTQDLNIEKRRKSSRRVSFADTINCRVFHRDVKNNAAERENEEDTENHVLLNQNEEPEAVPCEITGMNTLLHAPIQSLVQQTECHDVDNAIPRTDRPDTTLIFSDENEMDMTTSHTSVIARNLKNNNETDKTEKIDIVSFLAELNSANGKAEKSKDFHFSFAADRFCSSFEQKEDAATRKKINSNGFFMNSNEKALNPIEGPEKENIFFVPSQVSENMAQSSYAYSHEQLATCNVTKIFREQDDGMEMTKCQASDIQNMHSGLYEVPTEQLPSADVTQAFADDEMDMTTNHTAKMHFPFAIVSNQNLNFKKDFLSLEQDNYSVVKRTSHQKLIIMQDPQLCTSKKIINVEDTVDATALQAFKQETRTLSSIPGSVSSETVFRDDKTVVFSQCDDMEITGNYRDVVYNTSTKGMNSSCHKAFEKPVSRNSLLVERKHPVNTGSTRSLSLDDRTSLSHKNNARELSSGSDGQNERVIQDHSTASLNTGFNSCTNSVSTGSSRGRLQHRLANSLLVSLPGEKTAIFSGSDVDLTKNCVGKGYRRNTENESPPGMSNSIASKPLFPDSRSVSSNSREQEKMKITKCQAVVSGDQSIGITTEAKQMHCKIIPTKNQNNNFSDAACPLDRDKENLEAVGFDVSIRRSQAIEMSADGVEVVTVNRMLGKTDFQASNWTSCAKSMYSFQEQKREVSENIITDKCAFTYLQNEKVYVSQPLGNKLLNSSVSCTNDKRDMFSDNENMDITKAHSLVVTPINIEQENENTHVQNNIKAKQLQNQTFQFSDNSGIDHTSQAAAIECGHVKVSSKKQTVAHLAPSGFFVSSNELARSRNRRDARPGKILGIISDCQNADRHEKTHPMVVVNNVSSTAEDLERNVLISKTVSSEGGFNNPQSGDDLRLRGAEERSLASNSKELKGSSQLPSFLEKSVVFPSGENMDLTENLAVVAPDQNICTLFPGRKAAPGHIEDKSKISLKKEVMMMNNQKQPECDMYSGVSDKKMLTVTGIKHLLSADEKTTIFSEGANMDITGNHTASADNKTILQPEILNDDISFISEDKTSVFTKNNDMEISRLDSVAADNSMEKAVSQGMLSRTNGARRKSLKGTIGEKTVLFSMSENNDMSITEGLTAAINHEIISQNEVGLPSPSSAHPVRTVTFTSNQADIDTKSCSANKITVKVSCDDALISDKIVGQDVPSNREDTTFAMDDMEITKAHNVSLKENFLQGRQPNQSVPLTSSVMFTSDQADMEMTEYHPIDGRFEKDLCEDRLNLPTQVVQEALSGSKTVIFPLAENMDITKTHDVLSGKIGVWNGRSISAISAVPADKTIVFCHNQDDMEITSSHTIAVNNNTEGFENQEASLKSTQQPDLHSASSSSCRDEIDSLQIKDLNGRDHKISNTKPLIPSASSPSASPIEKGPIKVHSGTIPDSTYSVSIPKDALDVQALQDLGLSTENSIPINSEQDLLHPGAMKSRRVSLKLPGNVPLDCSEESEVVISHVFLPAQHSDSLKEPPDALSTQRNQVLKDDSCKHEDLATGLAMDGAGIVSVSKKESEENVPSAEGETTEFQINSGQTGSLNPVDLAPKLSGILNICSKLENIRRKSVVVSETVLSDHLAKLPTQPEDTLRLGRNSINEQRLCYAKEQENAYLESGTASIDANVGMALKDKYKRRNVPLGIFQPKLPNRRNPSVSSVQDINVKSSGKAESPVPEVNPNTVKAPGYDKSSRQNFSPSQFIAEEFLPVCPEEMDSNDSVSSEFVEEACNNSNKREVSHNEKIQVEETKSCNNAKRALKYVEEDLQSLKKLKMDETVVGGTSQDLQVTYGPVPESHTEVAESEDSPNISAKNSDCTQANSSSSLDSVKADTELTIQRSSQMESQLLTDSICEDNLWEKFQSGGITVGEFFTLLQVHVPIQKPRQSHIPASCAVSAPPTPEDLILSQYVYRPKMRIYEEDCQVLSQMIDELKQYVSVQDQPLVNVNKSLWEVMRTCSDEELKSFGAELNKMKSYFIKESKILAHNEKEALYSKLLQSAQEQYEKLQSRIANMDELLKEAESCLADLEADSEWEECETDCSDDEMEGEDSESRKLEEELGSLKAQEEELQRELSDLETENEQILAQMKHLQEDEKSCQELLERCNFTEWEISEWSERQAVFNFLYDSIELTVVFGTPIDGDVFGENPSRKIVSLSFESLLDEEKAPLSSCLVQRLIFQFIESQGCWQEKCPMLQYLPQVLHDVSLVVSRCRILGEEIEFLKKWGGKYNLLKTDIIDTNVKLLFSTSTAFAKFELTLSLSSNYPSSSLPFTVEKKIGNIGHEEISAVLSKVPIGYHYLRRMVSLIHQNLLQDPR
ncbi:kinetochore scaffold 1 isoform X2 [Meleagris gallopavo]|uniref:kinetochore scaffold 1 isoform X2 n=1 Tax=Meleagris gallopavo TaxID=9103 RepID=UPI000549E1A7|nr:kinetochore scaffold 1 isoform X2 [Meleagris gallopavo]